MTPSSVDAFVAPTFAWCPDHSVTLGPEVGEICALAGFPPDPEQQLILDAAFARQPQNGKRSLVRDVATAGPRQNYKTGVLKQYGLGCLYILEVPLTVWSAHEFSTTQESFRDMLTLIEGCPDLDAEVHKVHRGNGEECIELTGNRRLRFKARTHAGGRGLTGNRVILDEAMFLQATHMGALLPTLRAVPDPQLFLAGSAGMLTAAVWRGYRNRGRPGGDPSLAWFEWSDPAAWSGCEAEACDHLYGRVGCALDDRERWRATNLALGRRIDEASLEADRRSMPAIEFARETLGWWEDPPDGGGAFGLDAWAGLDIGSVDMTGPAFSVEVSPGRTLTTIGAAWDHDGIPHLEVVEDGPGTGWVVARVAELVGRYSALTVVLDLDTEAASLQQPLEDAGLAVTAVRGPGRAAACGNWHEAATARKLTHNGDPAISAAIAAATWRDVGDGRRVLSRRHSGGDIAALYAVVLALHGLDTGPDYDLLSSVG